MYKTIDSSDIAFFKNLLGNRCFTEDEIRLEYGHDETEDLQFFPDLVVKPSSVEEVSAILKYCFENTIVVTPSGARTGLSGGALPIEKGIALSM